MIPHISKEDLEKYNEVKRLYGLTEAEEILLIQLIVVVKSMGLSKMLASRLFQAASCIIDLVATDDKK